MDSSDSEEDFLNIGHPNPRAPARIRERIDWNTRLNRGEFIERYFPFCGKLDLFLT